MHKQSVFRSASRFSLLAALAGCAPGAHHPAPISPDRPGVAESTETVGQGVFQAEAGYSAVRVEEETSHSVGELMLRYGAQERIELRMGLNSYVLGYDHGHEASGFQDLHVSSKFRLSETHTGSVLPAAALLVGSSLPTGSELIGSSEAQPFAALALGWELPKHWKFDSYARYEHLSEGDERAGRFTGAAEVGFPLAERWHGHLEYARIAPVDHFSEGLDHLSGGVGFHLTHDTQLDLWTGWAGGHHESEYLFGIGVSRRWGAPKTHRPAAHITHGSSNAAHKPSGHAWGYKGAEGPAHWGELKAGYQLCETGREQSPINIPAATTTGLPALRFDYRSSPLKIVNNGHTIQVNYAPGSRITLGGKSYELLQFHFHTPSENQLNGKSYPMEGHLVHRAADGELAVVGVFMTRGAENPFIETLWSHMPEHEAEVSVPEIQVEAIELLPENQVHRYSFAGSLTTPPCTEGVRWTVLHQPIELSAAQIARFTKLFPNNARPVQPLNQRTVQGAQ